MRRLIAILAVLAVAGVYLVQCTPKDIETYNDARPISWRVGLAFPSSPPELIDRSTIGRWSTIADEIKDELIAHGFKDDDIILRQTDKRIEQVKQIDELVSEENVDELIVVPVEYSKDELTGLNGNPLPEYLKAQNTKDIAEITAANEKAKADAEAKKAADPKGNYEPTLQEVPKVYEMPKFDENYQKKIEKAKDDLLARTLETSLNDAKKKGIYIVGMGQISASGDLGNYAFDYEVDTLSPEDIANVQAGYAVAHLGLPELPETGELAHPEDTNYWPINIEIMTSDAVRPNSKRYFARLWERLSPYFKAGYLKSNSKLLTTSTTVDDFLGVAVTEDGDKSAGVMHDILDKYYKTDDKAHKISAIFTASDALSRGAVRAAVESGWSQTSDRWPLITGAGAEKISVSDIVENKQSMSIAYDSKKLSVAVAQILFNHALDLPQISKDNPSSDNEILAEAFDNTRQNGGTLYYSARTIEGISHPILQLITTPVTITNDNLKEFLIDNGYVQAAEAGL